MATLPPPPPNLPVFYNNLAPLSSTLHSKFKVRQRVKIIFSGKNEATAVDPAP